MGKVEGLLILLAIILLLFGAKKLPQLARSVGDSARELKKGFSGNNDEPSVAQKTEPTPSAKEK